MNKNGNLLVPRLTQVKLPWGPTPTLHLLCDREEGSHPTNLSLNFLFKRSATFRDINLLDSSLLILIPYSTREAKEKQSLASPDWMAGTLHFSLCSMLFPYHKPMSTGTPFCTCQLLRIKHGPARQQLSMREWGAGWTESASHELGLCLQALFRFLFESLSKAHCAILCQTEVAYPWCEPGTRLPTSWAQAEQHRDQAALGFVSFRSTLYVHVKRIDSSYLKITWMSTIRSIMVKREKKAKLSCPHQIPGDLLQ